MHTHTFLNNIIRCKLLYAPKELDRFDILSQILRYNKDLMIGNKTIVKNLNGIETINDLFDQSTNNFYNYNDIAEKFHINILTYNQLISCIRRPWKIILKVGTPLTIYDVPYIKTTNNIPVEKWTSQILYKQILNSKAQPPSVFQKWNINPIIQKDLIEQNYLLTNDTKTLDTQFRITHRFYHTQAQLFKWKLSAGPECLFCNQLDSLEHHFILCNKRNNFWNTLKI